jgi:hypothetical protein
MDCQSAAAEQRLAKDENAVPDRLQAEQGLPHPTEDRARRQLRAGEPPEEPDDKLVPVEGVHRKEGDERDRDVEETEAEEAERERTRNDREKSARDEHDREGE